MSKRFLTIVLAALMLLGCVSGAAAEGSGYTTETTADGWIKVTQEGGPTLGYDPESGVTLLEADGFVFKDLNKNGELDAYEDWRLSSEERAADLVEQLDVRAMSGLRANGAIFGCYSTGDETITNADGKDIMVSIAEDGLRYVIMYPIAFGMPIMAVAPTSNILQKAAEATTWGIPMMLNCDPTTGMTGTVTNTALAATMDPDAVAALSTNVAKLYRAAGITMSLSPQVELESDPRSQSTGAFTEDPALAADLVNAMISAYQSTYDEEGNDLGWGSDSIAVQMKHFFSNLSQEGGRNYHDFTGKYTVTPADMIDVQLYPFVKGGFTLNSKTEQVSAVMVTYTVMCDENGKPIDANRGGAWNSFLFSKLEENGFEGMVSTDSLIMDTVMSAMGFPMSQTAFNVSDMTRTQACGTMFKTGVDQSMGDLQADDINAAYEWAKAVLGEEAALANWKDAAYKCLLPIFRVGSFENPYVLLSESAVTAETLTPDVCNELAQSSIVMLKNNGVITQRSEKAKVYVAANGELPVSKKVLKNYFEVVDTPEEADYCIVLVDAPKSANTGWSDADQEWQPISLQYRAYCADADAVEETSLTGDEVSKGTESPYGMVATVEKENRGYYDATTTSTNEADLDLILTVAESGKPVVVCVNAAGAFCVDEFESVADAILVGFGVDKSNYLPIAAGQVEPSGLMPMQMPADMEAVEAQQSGTPRDMECYVDANGNTYDFCFGMNWSGVIDDARTAQYGVPMVTTLD